MALCPQQKRGNSKTIYQALVVNIEHITFVQEQSAVLYTREHEGPCMDLCTVYGKSSYLVESWER